MRSIEEIKRGLQICGDPEWEYCRGCPFEGDEDCTEKDRDALAYIHQLERERDAAVADMTELMQLAQFCRHCKRLTDDGECTFDFAANKDEPWCWQWRGVQQEVE